MSIVSLSNNFSRSSLCQNCQLQCQYISKFELYNVNKDSMSLNANEEMIAGYADPDASYPDADPDVT